MNSPMFRVLQNRVPDDPYALDCEQCQAKKEELCTDEGSYLAYPHRERRVLALNAYVSRLERVVDSLKQLSDPDTETGLPQDVKSALRTLIKDVT